MNYTDFIKETLEAGAKTALQHFGKVVATTKENDPNQVLTEADIAIGKYIVQRIKEIYPDHNIIDEEAGVVDNGSALTWVADPIEATSNFACGTPFYGIMLGLLDGDKPIAGGVILPSMGDIYLAAKGKGATRNGVPIRVSEETDPLKMLVSFGIDSQRNQPDRAVTECRVLADIVLSVRNMRNSGCEALDPMYVAEGKYGGRVETTAKIWDNVAPQIVAEEAGALWTDTNGRPIDYADPLKKVDQNFAFCVAPPAIHEHLIRIIDGRIEN